MLKSYFSPHLVEAGCDEAGRGCLAGPVVAAAVILPKGFCHKLLNDSKKLNEKQRCNLRPMIQTQALAWAVASVDHTKIDEINILRASHLAMHLAVEQLDVRPDLLLIDGNLYTSRSDLPFECIVKGDGLYYSIAAASILAKTYRDDLMQALHEEYPQYGWNKNKGYPTAAHKKAISQYGISPYHRLSFNLNDQLKLDFGQ